LFSSQRAPFRSRHAHHEPSYPAAFRPVTCFRKEIQRRPLVTSDGGTLRLREIEQRLRVAGRLAGCIRDYAIPISSFMRSPPFLAMGREAVA
jgi:hypothetical protein